MLLLRLKQAEAALGDGRLDEAAELAVAADFRAHARGQELIGKLARALVQRGREHLQAARLPQALADSQKAEKLAGSLAEVAQLKAALAQAIAGRQHEGAQKQFHLAQARQQIEQGWLSAGERILHQAAGDGGTADLLLAQVESRRAELEAAAKKVQEALERQDLQGALELLARKTLAAAQHSGMQELAGRVRQQALDTVREAMAAGRLDRAEAFLARMQAAWESHFEVRELAQFMEQFRRACRLIQAGQSHAAVTVLRQLKALLPEAKWLAEALKAAEQAAEALETLTDGPLGWMMLNDFRFSIFDFGLEDKKNLTSQISDLRIQSKIQNPKSKMAKEQPPEEMLPKQFILQVDGAGAFLVLRGETVRVGAISSDQENDLVLMAEPDLPQVTLERSEEDWFLRAARAVRVNEREVREKLLADGDAIELSRRCRLKYHRPNAASGTALLTLSGARLPRADIQKVVLLGRELILGADQSAHVRAAEFSEKVVLFLRDERLYCKGAGLPERTLDLEEVVNCGAARFVITKK